jgi:hypothetical protein
MTFISVTRLHLRSPLYLPAFLWNTFLSTWQVINTPGFKGGKLLADANQTYWTMTAWDEQAAMKIYRNRGTHRSVMPKIQDWCDEASFVHWQQEDSNLPDWIEVYNRMMQEGFSTKLSKPSSAHLERNIQQPRYSKLGLILHPRKKSGI